MNQCIMVILIERPAEVRVNEVHLTFVVQIKIFKNNIALQVFANLQRM